MIIDGTLIVIFLLSGWIGWSLRIYIDWMRMTWVILFAFLLWTVFPYFMAFVQQSSANLSPFFYYVTGIGMVVLIFLSFFALIHGKNSASGIRRFSGSAALAVISFYSLVIVLSSMAAYGWIDVNDSFVFSLLPAWLLNPFE